MGSLTEAEFKEKAKELFRAIEERIFKNLNVDSFARDLLNIISEAKKLFEEGKISEALQKYSQAIDKLEKAEISNASEPLAWKLLSMEIVFLIVILLAGYLTCQFPSFRLWKGFISYDIQTAYFGALGGVTIAIWGLVTHIQARDFDPKYQMWYICKPITGGIFGWFVCLIFYIGVISVQGMSSDSFQKPQLSFAIAFLAGFSERFTIKMIDRLMNVLMTWEEKPKAAEGKKPVK
jgi:hypothetical protein